MVRAGSVLVMAALLALTLLAGAARLSGLDAPDGRLDTDEARLALAAQGVLETGLPVMPSGRIYTRGLLNSYLMAPALAWLGAHDFAARLPSALAGTLLVPVVFLLARRLGGAAAGLAAASYVALAEPLVEASRSAWLPSVFLLLFTFTAYACYRGFSEGKARWQVIGGGAFILAALSYEFAVLLPLALGIWLVSRLPRGNKDWYRGRPTLLAFGLLAGGLALAVFLALALRAGTLAGSLSEVDAYLEPSGRLSGVMFYAGRLLDDTWWLLIPTLVGLLLRPHRASLLIVLLLLTVLVPAFVVQNKYAVRYILPALPLLAVLGATGWTRVLESALQGANLARVRGPLVAAGLLVLVGPPLLDQAAAVRADLARVEPGPTWLQVTQQLGIQPDDLLLTESPTIVQWYLGRNEFYVPLRDSYERYAYRASDGVRSAYTDALMIGRRGDFERLIEAPYAGRTLWILAREERLEDLTEEVDARLLPSLMASADRATRTWDDWLLLRVELPRQRPRAHSRQSEDPQVAADNSGRRSASTRLTTALPAGR